MLLYEVSISLSGFSSNHGAVQRWVLTTTFRAQVQKYFNNFTNYKASPKHQHLLPSRINKDQRDVQIVYDTINILFINLFSEMDIVSLSTGVTSPKKIKNDLLNSKHTGEKMKEFVYKRLVNQTMEFFDWIDKLKLGTFSKMQKTVRMGRQYRLALKVIILAKWH